MTKRNKQLFSAQEMLVLLAQLAYNLITWTRAVLTRTTPFFRGFGVLRMVRDVFQIPGHIDLDAQGHLIHISLRASHPYAAAFVLGLAPPDDLSLILHQI